MIGFLTYDAVVCLARRRLVYVRDVLAAKLRDGVGVNVIDRQVHHLASKAVEMLAAQPHVDVRLDEDSFAPWLVEEVSRYALLGALGPEIPRFAALHADGHEWLFDTIHRGTPDPDRARVYARSTDLAMAIWDQAQGRLTDTADRARLKAFMLGYLCHIATDVVMHPLLADAAWLPGDGLRPRANAEAVALALEHEVSRKIFGRPDFTRGDWSGWLPQRRQVPDALFDAWKDALEVIYGAGARPAGSRAFMERLARHSPPALSSDLLQDGLRNWHAAVTRDYGWSYGEWLGVTALMYVPTIAAAFVTHELDKGKHLFGSESSERAWYEIIGLPLAFNAALPVGYFLYAALGTHLGMGKETGVALASAIVSAAAAVGYFITAFDEEKTLGEGDTDVALRWSLFIALPAAMEIFNFIYVLARTEGEQGRLLAFASLAHVVLVGVFLLGYWWLIQPIAAKDFDDDETWWRVLLWVLLIGGVWTLSALFLWLGSRGHRQRLADLVKWSGGQQGDLGGPRYARLFDDGTLFHDPGMASPPTLADRYFPSRRRPLLKLWWSGPGMLFVRSRRDHLEFTTSLSPPAPVQQILVPLGPMTLADYALYLARYFGGPGATAPVPASPPASPPGGPLSIALHEDLDWDYVVPAGRLFAAFGDTAADTAAAITASEQFQPIPRLGQPALELHHAPHAWTSVQYGRTRPHLPLRGVERGAGTVSAIGAPAGGVNDVQGNHAARFQTLFHVGDLFRTVGLPANETLRVVTVHSQQRMTLSGPLSAAVVAGTGYLRLRAEAGAGRVQSAGVPAGVTVQGDANTRFWTLFEPGDLIVAAGQTRVVQQVTADNALTVSCPFSPVLPAGTAYQRIPDDRDSDVGGVGVVRLGATDFLLAGTGTQFDEFFRVGDRIRITNGGRHEERTVSAIASATSLTIDQPLLTVLNRTTTLTGPYARVGRLDEEGYPLTPATPTDLFSGSSGLDAAADLAALLCLGGASRMLSEGELSPTSGSPVGRAYQVFRNWNLDQRRANEWRTLITGRATNERLGGVDALRPASPPRGATGAHTASRVGWVPMFRQWLDMARRRGVDSRDVRASRPGLPSNRDLSSGLAFLLGLSDA